MSDSKLPAAKTLRPEILAAAELVRAPTMASADSPAPARPAFPAGPEPARVYGYLAFVDPATGTEWVPHQADNPIQPVGAPGPLGLRFVNSAGEIFAMSLWAPYIDVGRNPDGSVDRVVGWHPWVSTAWYYDIQMNPDRTEGVPREGAPRGVVTNPLRTGAISYNPDQWRFLDVVGPDPYNLTPPPPGSHEEPFTRRDTPFPDLPDTD